MRHPARLRLRPRCAVSVPASARPAGRSSAVLVVSLLAVVLLWPLGLARWRRRESPRTAPRHQRGGDRGCQRQRRADRALQPDRGRAAARRSRAGLRHRQRRDDHPSRGWASGAPEPRCRAPPAGRQRGRRLCRHRRCGVRGGMAATGGSVALRIQGATHGDRRRRLGDRGERVAGGPAGIGAAVGSSLERLPGRRGGLDARTPTTTRPTSSCGPCPTRRTSARRRCPSRRRPTPRRRHRRRRSPSRRPGHATGSPTPSPTAPTDARHRERPRFRSRDGPRPARRHDGHDRGDRPDRDRRSAKVAATWRTPPAGSPCSRRRSFARGDACA